MPTYRCPSCAKTIEIAARCPYCGADQGEWAEELARIERSIAEMKAREVAIAQEQQQIAAKIQAAIFQRDILAHANSEKRKQPGRARRILRRRAAQSPTAGPADTPTAESTHPSAAKPASTPTSGPAAASPSPDPTQPRRVPRQPDGAPTDRPTPPRPPHRPPLAPEPPVRPEASTREVQNIMLGLGALLLGIAAVVFAAVAISSFGALSRLAILLLATGMMLTTAPLLARRGLTATAETVAAVGLLLVTLNGYAVWLADEDGSTIVPGWLFASLTFLVTAVVCAAYAAFSRLAAPRYATVLAAQPVLPLLAYGWITGATGWSLVLSAVAAIDIYLGWLLSAPARRALPGWVAAPAPWLRELTWSLHGLAALLALGSATVALVNAVTVPTAGQAGVVLVLATLVGLTGALALGHPTLIGLAAGVTTLALMGAGGRIAAVALPGRSLVLIAAVIALVGLGVRALPAAVRRGPQLASAVALLVMAAVVAGGALRAALAPIRAATPVWAADLDTYPSRLAEAVGPAGWQLAVTTCLLTITALLALPARWRREGTILGLVLTALATPASFGLDWWLAPWPMVLTAIGIGVAGLVTTGHAATCHAFAALLVGLGGAGAAATRPELTAAVLLVLAAAGAAIALLTRMGTGVIAEWAAGGAAFALPGAVAAAVAVLMPADPTPTASSLRGSSEPILVASFLAVCVTLGYAAITQVAHRRIPPPLAVGAGLGALAVATATLTAPGGTLADTLVGVLLLGAAILLLLTPSIDANRRSDRLLDGADYAAAAVTVGLLGTLARATVIMAPGGALIGTALLILLIAVGVRAMPEYWRRGPVLGLALGGGLVALLAGYPALRGGMQVLLANGQIWAADLDSWSVSAGQSAWQAPAALVLLATAAAILLPRPWAYDIAAVCVGLATVGLPAALGLSWWSPILVGGLVAIGYGMAAVATDDPRATLARAAVAAAVALHAVGASLVRPWTTAVALGAIAGAGVLVAALARLTEPEHDRLPGHLAQLGGAATGAALFAFPGSVAALAAQLEGSTGLILTAALAASSAGIAVLALVRPWIPQYLPYASIGVTGAATLTALVALVTGQPWGLYAAGAALLGVLAELIRAVTLPPGDGWTTLRRWSISPANGALAAAALPTALALAAMVPTLIAVLVEPYRTLGRVWAGPLATLRTPDPDLVDGRNILAALLLTVATALAAAGFTGNRPARAIPVVLPGAALTLLITPVCLGAGWPASTMAALMVFTLAMLGLALTPPPAASEQARFLRVTRALVFGIGLAAGGAGLAGSLATRELTLFTLGGAVGVGAVAALAGRSQPARILGWLFASLMAQLFVLVAGLIAGLAPAWSAFGVLAVGALLLVASTTLPRLRSPEAAGEAAVVEWSGYAAALITISLAYGSPRHLAALLAAWGAVLGVSAVRPNRHPTERRTLFWAAVACEIGAWWLLMRIAEVALPEAYTLPFAALALLVGVLELRHRPDLNSWLTYGPALVAAFLPTLAIVLATDTGATREVLLLFGGVGTLILGSLRRQQAPVIVGALVTALVAVHALFSFGAWLVLIPVGFVLMALGASNEQRRRDAQERLRGALRGLR